MASSLRVNASSHVAKGQSLKAITQRACPNQPSVPPHTKAPCWQGSQGHTTPGQVGAKAKANGKGFCKIRLLKERNALKERHSFSAIHMARHVSHVPEGYTSTRLMCSAHLKRVCVSMANLNMPKGKLKSSPGPVVDTFSLMEVCQ